MASYTRLIDRCLTRSGRPPKFSADVGVRAPTGLLRLTAAVSRLTSLLMDEAGLAPDADSEVIREFHAAMARIYTMAKSEAGYNATPAVLERVGRCGERNLGFNPRKEIGREGKHPAHRRLLLRLRRPR